MRVDKITNEKTNFTVVIFLLLILSWMTFQKLIGIRFTNPDDMWFSVVSFKDYFAVAGEDARATGRIGMLYATAYLQIISAFWNTPIWDIAMYGSVVAVMLGILGLAHYLGYLRLGLLFVTLYLSFIPITYGFNLFVSYPFRYTSGILLWLAALFLIEKHLRSNRSVYLWIACALSFVAYIHHETLFAIFASVNMIFVVARQNGGGLKQRLSHRATSALFLTSIAYVVIFVAWYLAHPTSYAGNTVQLGKAGFLSGYVSAVTYYLTASLPLNYFFAGYTLPFIAGGTELYSAVTVPHDFISVVGNIEAGHVARSCVIAAIFFIALAKLPPHINAKKIRALFAVGLTIFILPPAIISLSYTYQSYVRGGYAPVHITFFSYFGSILLIATAIVVLLNYFSPKPKKIIIGLLALAVGAGGLASDVFNTQVSEVMHLNTARWNVAATLIRHFQAHGSNTSPLPKLIVAPQLWNSAGAVGNLPDNYWQRLIALQTGLDIQFSPTRFAEMPVLSATMYYDCPTTRNCVIMLQYRSRAIEVISTTSQPRFLSYSENDEAKTVKVIPILEQSPTLLHAGVYIATLPADYTSDLSKWRIEL
jgi:hypothetical protein